MLWGGVGWEASDWLEGGRLELLEEGFVGLGAGLPLAGPAHAALGRALFVFEPFVGVPVRGLWLY